MTKYFAIQKKSITFAADLKTHITTMSEKEKVIEQERKGVLELMLKKVGATRKQLADDLIGMWMAGNTDLLTDQEKKQFPHLAW